MKTRILNEIYQYRKLTLQDLAAVLLIEAGSSQYKSMCRAVSSIAKEGIVEKQKIEGGQVEISLVLDNSPEEPVVIEVDKEPPANPLGIFTWTENDGVVKNVWEKPPFVNKHRALWTCHWLSEKTIRPDDLGYLFSAMSKGEIVAELRDIGARGNQKAMLQFVLGDISVERPDDVNMYAAEHIISEARKNYHRHTFLCPWSLPPGKGIVRPVWRPGWSTPEIEASFKAGGYVPYSNA